MKFVILGEPTPKQSARFRTVKTGNKSFIQSYQKEDVIRAERNISFDIKSQLPHGHIPFDVPLKMNVLFVFPPLKSWSKKKMADFTSGITFFKETKPDVDNLTKLLMDSMNKIVFIDDARVVKYSTQKIYGQVPRIEIEIETL